MASATVKEDHQAEDNVPESKPSPSLTNLLSRLVKNCFLLVARFYIMCILIAYEWTVKILMGALKPLEPVAIEVRKVPKKDISIEGIFYQFLRLQFLVLLYVTPLIRNAASYVTSPLFRLREWAVVFVDGDINARQADVRPAQD